jgi:putative sterol carrier protein/putative NADPH-quinone reductase
MNALAINSSARAGQGSKTEILLDSLVEGMREAGAEVEVVNLRQKDVRYCIGCFTCWTKTPGKCVHPDDMTKELFPKYVESDLVILATPLYHYTVNAQLKTFIERTLPVALPFFVERGGVTRHPLRRTPPPVVMLSVAGFPEASVFDQLSSYARYLFGERLAAEIYRPSSEMFRADTTNPRLLDVLNAARQGGRELAETGRISPDTLGRIVKPITEFKTMAPIGNLVWQTCIDEGVTMMEFQKRGMVPRPNSLETFLAVMQMGFNPARAEGARAAIQFDFSGQVNGTCHFAIADGALTPGLGPAASPNLTIAAPFEVWMDILTRKADGQQMFLEKKYTASGDVGLLPRFAAMFGG